MAMLLLAARVVASPVFEQLPPPPSSNAERRRAVLRTARVRRLVLAVATAAAGLGLVEASVPKLASRTTAGLFLALLAVGSAVGGILVAQRAARRRVHYTIALLVLMAAASQLLGAAESWPLRCLALILIGVAIAPLNTIGLLAVHDTAPSERAGEAATCYFAAATMGVGGGAAIGGWLINVADVAVELAIASTLLAVLAVVIGAVAAHAGRERKGLSLTRGVESSIAPHSRPLLP